MQSFKRCKIKKVRRNFRRAETRKSIVEQYGKLCNKIWTLTEIEAKICDLAPKDSNIFEETAIRRSMNLTIAFTSKAKAKSLERVSVTEPTRNTMVGLSLRLKIIQIEPV